MEFEKYLRQTSKKLDGEMGKILDNWLNEVGKIDKGLVPLAKAFIKACYGGKVIRGVLVKLGYEIAYSVIPARFARRAKAGIHTNNIYGSLLPKADYFIKYGMTDNEILKIGAAYEILHSSVLIHDDIIDKSPKRRGQKSLYKIVGQDQAITLGDLGFFLAGRIISESKFEEKRKIEALKLFSKTMAQTAIGQMIDIQKGDPKTLRKLKTAYYTIAAPLQLGAILGGADKKLLGRLGKLGEMLGVAYQVRDDILDGDAMDSSGQMGVEYVARSKKLIPGITSDKNMQKLLWEMADYIVERSK